MSEQSQNERRRFTRIPFSKSVTLYSGMEAFNTQIIDISLKGVLLALPEKHQPAIGGLYRLNIPMEGFAGIIMNIEVIHVKDNCFGAEWTQIDMDSFSNLKRTIELNVKKNDDLRKDIKTLSE